MITITKHCPDAEHQYNWLLSLRSMMMESTPDNLRFDNGTLLKHPSISYNFVEGVHPTIEEAWPSVVEMWQCGKEDLPFNTQAYCEYVIKLFFTMDWPSWCHGTIAIALGRLAKWPLTPVKRCHGDLTLTNMIMTSYGMVFIDPGFTRSLPCRELDESKLMQSTDGWSKVRYGISHHGTQWTPFPKLVVHRVLLMTHYVRLLAHNHPEKARDFAKKRVIEILSEF